jgi:hypothetical protein
MITYFTTAKDFIGKTRVAQLNAIRSWQHSVENAQIIIFGKSEGIEELADQPGIFLHPEVKTSSEGTPHIDDMFIKAQQSAEHDICCFINADIIIPNGFAETIVEIHKALKTGYLIVGQRYDVRVDREIPFDDQWETTLNDLVRKGGRRHAPEGSDFFGFPTRQYGQDDIPGLLAGRAGWDLWMIYHGRTHRYKVVDISPTITVVHQDHDYSHRKTEFISYESDPEARLNLRHLPVGETYPYTLLACNYSYKNGKIRRNLARCNIQRFISYELHLRRLKSPFREMRTVLKLFKLVR